MEQLELDLKTEKELDRTASLERLKEVMAAHELKMLSNPEYAKDFHDKMRDAYNKTCEKQKEEARRQAMALAKNMGWDYYYYD